MEQNWPYMKNNSDRETQIKRKQTEGNITYGSKKNKKNKI